VRCSLCQFEHELHPQQPPASSAAAAAGAAASEPTDADLVRLIPINASLMESISRGQQLERMVREQQQQLQGRGSNPCTYPDCAQPALFWCDDCEGELCTAHDRDLHPAAVAAAASASSSAAHRRTPLSERAAARQAKMAARLAANGANLRVALLSCENHATERSATYTADLKSVLARFEQQSAQIRAQIAASEAAELAAKSLSAKMAPLSDTELLKHEARINQLVGAPVLPDSLLAELSVDRQSDLERFLQIAGVSLVIQQRD
jgi:hypothetical protein